MCREGEGDRGSGSGLRGVVLKAREKTSPRELSHGDPEVPAFLREVPTSLCPMLTKARGGKERLVEVSTVLSIPPSVEVSRDLVEAPTPCGQQPDVYRFHSCCLRGWRHLATQDSSPLTQDAHRAQGVLLPGSEFHASQ